MGCNGGCTEAVINDIVAAAKAEADYALVLVPSYFHFAMTTDAINEFFLEVADRSPIPIVIYNFPGVVSGLDVNSGMLDRLGEHPNIVAVKLTCGGIAKVARVSAKFGAFNGQDDEGTFRALAGQSDWLVPALAAGGAGCITGLANLYPRVSEFPRALDNLLTAVIGMHRNVQSMDVGSSVRSKCAADQPVAL